MKFFIPEVMTAGEAETIYEAIAKFNGASTKLRRIQKLSLWHNGKSMSCAVGEPAPAYYQTGNEPVIAILERGPVYLVCTPNRGVVRGEPILCGADSVTSIKHFD